jgi:hypothetical protein
MKNCLYLTDYIQEVLGRTNRLRSLIGHRSQRKRCVQELFYCCVCILWCVNVSTEPLPSNDKGLYIYTQTDGRDL